MAGPALLCMLSLAVLMLFQTPEGAVAQVRDKTSSGNNMNFTITPNGNGMWHGRAGGSIRTQWPKGLGRYYGGLESYSGGGPIFGCGRDLDGDVGYEDTVFSQVRHGEPGNYLSTPSAQDLIETWYAAGNIMSSQTNDVFYNRAYSTNDPNDFPDDWPVEFRDENGEPVTKGNETIVCRVSDTFNESMRAGSAPMGCSVEAAHYFLSFGANKDIVYVDWKFQNMSEYCVYNDNPDYAAVSPPGGSTWMGTIVGIGLSQVYAGERDDVWGVLSSKNLGVVYDRNGEEAWGAEVGLIGYKFLSFPEFEGQQAKLLESATGWCSGFGTSDPNMDPMDYGEDHTVYRWFAHLQTAAGEQVGPYTPEYGGTVWGWPGVSYSPDEEYWDHWRFVGANFYDMGITCGFLDDVDPRESFTMAVAVMFTLPGGDGRLLLDPDYPNTKSMEAHCTTVVELSDYAQDSYDAGLQSPMPPVVPTLTVIPGDRKVTLTWDDVSITTPDPYWQLLEDKGENPLGNYKKYDFAGFKLYRCFTGPGDPIHEELLGEWEYPNVPFYYVDEWAKELAIYSGAPRLANGFRVWYALVPYDQNNVVDENGEITGEISLEAGKVWNNTVQDYYQIIPRSDANEFKAASMLSYTYVPETKVAGATATIVSASSIELSGDGSGKLTEAPKYLEPQVDITFVPVNNQRIQQDFTIYVSCSEMLKWSDWGGCNWSWRETLIQMLDASGNVIDEPSPLTGSGDVDKVYQSTLDADGINYALEIEFQDMPDWGWAGIIYYDLNAGGYTGATIDAPAATCEPVANIGTRPGIGGWLRNAEIQVTWKSVGDDLSVDVVDNTHGITIPFGLYADANNSNSWGFMPAGTYSDFWNEIAESVPPAERSVQMLDKIPAANADEFGLWINGLV